MRRVEVESPSRRTRTIAHELGRDRFLRSGCRAWAPVPVHHRRTGERPDPAEHQDAAALRSGDGQLARFTRGCRQTGAAFSDTGQRYRAKSYSGAPRPMKMGNTRSPWHYYEPRTRAMPSQPVRDFSRALRQNRRSCRGKIIQNLSVGMVHCRFDTLTTPGIMLGCLNDNSIFSPKLASGRSIAHRDARAMPRCQQR